MADDIKLKIQLDTGEVVEGFLDIDKKGKNTARNIETSFNGSFSGLSSSLRNLGIAFAAAFSVNKIVNFLQDSAKAASEAERANTALSASLAQIGRLSPQYIQSFSDYASALQRTTGIEDDLIKQNAALLVSLGNLSGQTLKDATKASLDLSRALQIDVGTAFDLVAKAASGNVGVLSRYGIKIDENIPKSEKFAATLDLIKNRFGGLAEANLTTFEGSLDNLGNAFGELKEAIGGLITSSPALRGAINFISESMFNFADSLSGLSKGEDAMKGILDTTIQFAGILNSFVIAPFEVFLNLLSTGFLTIKGALDTLVVGVVGLTKIITEAVVFPIRDAFLGLSKAAGFFSSDLASKISTAAMSISGSIVTPLQQEYDKVKEIQTNTFNAIAASAENDFKVPVSQKIQDFVIGLKEAIDTAKTEQEGFKNNTVSMSEAVKTEYSDLTKALKNTFAQGVSKTFQEVGVNLQKGKGLFDDFGSSVVGFIADMVIQIGNALIVQGLAIEAFISAINSLLPGSGVAAAAAGIGLVLFGSALKASVGKGGSSESASTSSAGGGIASSPSASTELTQEQQLERQEPQTQVSVVIQGDVLDSDESGSRIVSLINQAFDKKGVVINQGVMA